MRNISKLGTLASVAIGAVAVIAASAGSARAGCTEPRDAGIVKRSIRQAVNCDYRTLRVGPGVSCPATTPPACSGSLVDEDWLLVHEMLHLIAPTHSEHFLALLSKHWRTWREARAELNELPLGAADWSQ